MADVFRIVIPTDIMNEDSWLLAAGYAAEIAVHRKPPSIDVVLLTHTKQQLEHTSLAAHLGTGAKALAVDRRAKGTPLAG